MGCITRALDVFLQVWSFGPVGPGSKAKSMVLPRAAQSLEALYRDLQAHKLDVILGGSSQALESG